MLTSHRSRSRDRDRDRDRDRRDRDRDRDRERDREKEREKEKLDPEKERLREKEREKEKERKKRGLPPIKKDHLSVCSTTLWVGHLSKVRPIEFSKVMLNGLLFSFSMLVELLYMKYIDGR